MGRTTRVARNRLIYFDRQRQDAAPLRPRGAKCVSRTRPHGSPADADISSPALSYHQQSRKRLSRQEQPIRRTCPVSRNRHHGVRRPNARKEGGNSGSVPEQKPLYINGLRGGGGSSHQRTLLHDTHPRSRRTIPAIPLSFQNSASGAPFRRPPSPGESQFFGNLRALRWLMAQKLAGVSRSYQDPNTCCSADDQTLTRVHSRRNHDVRKSLRTAPWIG
jgi:hypothetical protein